MEIRPFIPPGTHPVETGRYILETNEINRLHEKVSTWVENRVSGGIVVGRPRLGKTKAIKYISQQLPGEAGAKLPIYNLLGRSYKSLSENFFFEDFLRDVGHAFVNNGKVGAKRLRLIKFLIEQGEESGLQRVVIFIDDAQKLVEIQYGWLMDIYNELDRYGISLTIILVGQEELIHQRQAFILAKKGQIIGRFMVQDFNFRGIKNNDDIRSCLMSYDETMYPVDTDWSFTRYFFPDLFADGFRLENHANDIFNTFMEIRAEAKFKKPFEIPMQYLTRVIEYVLKNYGVDGENLNKLSITQWRKAIFESGYVEAEMHEDFI